MRIILSSSVLALTSLIISPALASSADATARSVRATKAFHTIEASIGGDYDRIVADAIKLTEIPAPTFKEADRAAAFADMLRTAGLKNVSQDAAGNVLGLRKGSGKGPLLVVVAHMDTVFPEGTAVKVRREGNMLYAPGIGDDSFALSVLAAYVRALAASKVSTASDILFMGSVGEEGLGNLRGMHELLDKGPYAGKVGSVIVLEPAAPGQMITTAVGSNRYKVTFTGPGGHSFSDFGTVNPAYAMAGAITAFSRIKVDPATRTTYNIGTVVGGTSVNAIPYEVSMTVDMRSNDADALQALDTRFHAVLDEAKAAENAARSTAKGAIAVTADVIGIRPAGHMAPDAPLIERASAAMRSGGLTPRYDAHGTDANLPMSMGIPSIVIGHGIRSEKGHSLEEFVALDEPHDVPNMATALLAILLQAGIKAR
ncbi:M20/M25/M40 family metallo-hydrolase [soil metagenome]